MHLSYHGGEHYNSVRLTTDTGHGPAQAVSGEAVTPAPDTATASESRAERALRIVRESTACPDNERVQATLRECEGDVDAAIEVLVAQRAAGDWTASPQDQSGAAAPDRVKTSAAERRSGTCGGAAAGGKPLSNKERKAARRAQAKAGPDRAAPTSRKPRSKAKLDKQARQRRGEAERRLEVEAAGRDTGAIAI